MFSGKRLFTLITQLKHRVNLCSYYMLTRQNFGPTWCILQDNYPSSFINSHKILLPKLPTNLPFNSFVVLPFVQGILERQQQIKITFNPLKTANSLLLQPKPRKRLTGQNLEQCNKSAAPTTVLYTTVKLKDH